MPSKLKAKANDSEFSHWPVMDFMPMDVVHGGVRDSTGTSQLCCACFPFKGKRVARLILLTVQLQASAASLEQQHAASSRKTETPNELLKDK